MLRNYFKAAGRTLRKNPAIRFIKITGLSIGMSAAILIHFHPGPFLKGHYFASIDCVNSRNASAPLCVVLQPTPGGTTGMEGDGIFIVGGN